MKRLLVLAAALTAASAQAPFDTITPDSLRQDLSYLASDALEGRGTPSAGLDLAATYIADQFQREGLKPAGPNGSYFQVAKFTEATPDPEGFELTLSSGDRRVAIASGNVRIRALRGCDLSNVPIERVSGEPSAASDLSGRAVIVNAPGDPRKAARLRNFLLTRAHPAIVISYGPPPRQPDRALLGDAETGEPPLVRISDPAAIALFKSDRPVSISLHLPAPRLRSIELRNVAAVLEGSHPTLRNQYLLLTAHYDHLGTTSAGIFRGANDDASGTASVIAIAGALAHSNPHPARSILFMTFFGEEEGLLGSRYYVDHPLVPLADTVADINLEQLGRTDEESGPEIGAFAFTGPSYTNIPELMKEPARSEGVSVYRKSSADSYFDRSDNYSFARRGVPDTTIAVAFEFPDYHDIGDTADKIDFRNLARVDRAIAAGLLRIAGDLQPPRWMTDRFKERSGN